MATAERVAHPQEIRVFGRVTFVLTPGLARLQNTNQRTKVVHDYIHYEKFNSDPEEPQIQQIAAQNKAKRHAEDLSRGVLGLGIFACYGEFLSNAGKNCPIRCRCAIVVLASASSGERTRESFVRPSPLFIFEGPRPSAVHRLRLPATGRQTRPRSPPSTPVRPRRRPAPNSCWTDLAARRAPVNSTGGLYENLRHQGHPKRWHCRPRRHRKDATGVVVAPHRGHDAALGKSCGRNCN